MTSLLTLLEGGDRRSLGRAGEVVAMVAKNPRLFRQLIAGLWSDDPIVRMRASDAAEKVTREKPALLRPYKEALFSLMAEAEQAELRWHLALMIPRVAGNPAERRRASMLLQEYLKDRHAIVKTLALQGLFELAILDAAMKPLVIDILDAAARNGSPAMRARSRKLLGILARDRGTILSVP